MGGDKVEEGTYDKLCGGTFFTLLLKAKKQRIVIRKRYETKSDNLSEPTLFAGLIKVAKPGYIEPEKQKNELREQERKKLKKITSNFKNCQGATRSECIPFTQPIIIEFFDKSVRTEYKVALNNMQEFTDNFIDAEIGIGLIERLIELIEFDKSIMDTEDFFVCPNGQPISKTELCNLSKISMDAYLPAFLLGIWHFVICNRSNNNEGRETIVSWHEEHEVKGRLGKYIGPKKSNCKRQIKLSELDENDEYTGDTTNTVLEKNEPFTHGSINDFGDGRDTTVVKAVENKTRSDQMKEIFVEAIEKYNIAGFMNDKELASSRRVFEFVEEIKLKIVGTFIGSQKEWMYTKILDFTRNLENYNGTLTMVRPSCSEYFYLINTNETLLNDFEKSVVPFRSLINSLYGEICDGETLYVY